MRTLIFLLAIMNALLLSSFIFLLDLHQKYEVPFIDWQPEKVIYNSGSSALPLYPIEENTPSPKTSLQAGEHLPYQYSGKAQEWQYVSTPDGTVYSVREDTAKQRLLIYHFVLSQQMVDNSLWPIGAGLTIFLLFLILTLFNYIKKQDDVQAYIDKHLQVLKLSMEQQARNHQEKIKHLHEKSTEKDEQIHDQHKQLKALENTYQNLSKQHMQLKKKEAFSNDALDKESIDKKHAVADNSRLVKEAKVFGIDFMSESYDNILKGRKYENIVAESLAITSSTKLLEWTSDKGILQKIWVGSNGNPDLIIDFNGSHLAIECKYRSLANEKNIDKDSPLKITYADSSSVDCYRQFSESKKTPVYIALGLQGDPSDPLYTYLIPLSKLIGKYSAKEIKGKKQEVLSIADIKDYQVIDHNYEHVLKKTLTLDTPSNVRLMHS